MTGEKPRRISIAAAVLFCAACAAPDQPSSGAVAPPSATRPVETVVLGSAVTSGAPSDDYRAGWASRLIGRPVTDPRGSHLGLLSDFIVRTGSGAVRYGVVSNKRAPGGERLVAVPLRLLHVTDEDALLLDLARERFDRLAWWAPDRWPVLRYSTAWGELDRFWGLKPLSAGALDDGYRVSRLMGTYVDDPAGRHLGRLIDVVIDLDRHAVHYTVLRLQGHPGVPPDHTFAVPLESLTLTGSGRATLPVSQARLMSLVGTHRCGRGAAELAALPWCHGSRLRRRFSAGRAWLGCPGGRRHALRFIARMLLAHGRTVSNALKRSLS